jgi:hypothetical protein
MKFALHNSTVTDMAFVLTNSNIYLTTDRTIKSAMKAEHQKNFKNCSQEICLFLYFQFFWFITVTPLEPSTSLTPHYEVPHSLCHRTLARRFAALRLVKTRILSIHWTPLYRREIAPSPSARCLAVGLVIRHPLFACCVSVRRLPCYPLAVSPWDKSTTRSLSHCVSMRKPPSG